ncbi:CvpA family protein, partial [Akkermansiaceae bacterium]|nr:CvpA family protein [Akkermansiaceae bacterium]
MTFDSIGANGIILIILAVFAILGFIKSLVKFFFNLIALAIGAVAGLWGYNNGFTLAGKVIEKPEPWMSIAIGVIAFLGAFSIFRTVLKFLSGRGSEDGQVRSMGFGLPGGIFGLLFGGFIAYSLLTGVRYAGTVSELEQFKGYLAGKVEEGSKQPIFSKLKNWIDSSLLGQWHQKIDFLNDPEQAELAKLAIVKENQNNLTSLVPQIPRAEVLDTLAVDQSVQDSIERGDYGALLRNK